MQDKNLDNEARETEEVEEFEELEELEDDELTEETEEEPEEAPEAGEGIRDHKIFIPKSGVFREEPDYVSFIDSCKRQVSDFQTIGGRPAYETLYETSKNKPKFFERPKEKLLSNAKTFSVIGLVTGPVSLIIGGLFMAGIGLILNFVTMKLLANVKTDDEREQALRTHYGRYAKIGLGLNLVSVAINGFGMYLYVTQVMPAM